VDDNFAQTFRRRLAETIAWCSTRPLLATVPELLATRRSDYERWQWGHGEVVEFLAPILRTPELKPRGFKYPATTAQRVKIMERLAETRALLLRDAGLSPRDSGGDLAGGRLLLYDPDGTDSSGGSWATSSGLFDVEDAPPWDCWIAFVHQKFERPPEWPQRSPEWETCVVNWIPPTLLAVAEDGIRGVVMDCVIWADDTDMPITRLLRAEGLLA
jgi:hypothetical protein